MEAPVAERVSARPLRVYGLQDQPPKAENPHRRPVHSLPAGMTVSYYTRR